MKSLLTFTTIRLPISTVIALSALFLLAFADTQESWAQQELNTIELDLSGPLAPAQPTPQVEQENLAPLSGNLTLEASLSPDSEILQAGIQWRVFSAQLGPDGTMPMVTERSGGTISFQLPPAEYLIHASFGRSSVVRRISVGTEPQKEIFVLNAGGIRLSANLAEKPLMSEELNFEIYSSARDENGQRTLIVNNIKAGQLVSLSEGRYHVVSRYGAINAIVRADLSVQAGKLTEAVMEQNGAKIDVKLTAYGGNEAIANTAWSVQTQGGEEVFASSQANPNFILGTGSYVIVAQHAGGVTTREITVKSGKNQSVNLNLAQ